MEGGRDGRYGGVRWQRRGEAWRGCQCARDGCMALQSERDEARPRRVEKKGGWLGVIRVYLQPLPALYTTDHWLIHSLPHPIASVTSSNHVLFTQPLYQRDRATRSGWKGVALQCEYLEACCSGERMRSGAHSLLPATIFMQRSASGSRPATGDKWGHDGYEELNKNDRRTSTPTEKLIVEGLHWEVSEDELRVSIDAVHPCDQLQCLY